MVDVENQRSIKHGRRGEPEINQTTREKKSAKLYRRKDNITYYCLSRTRLPIRGSGKHLKSQGKKYVADGKPRQNKFSQRQGNRERAADQLQCKQNDVEETWTTGHITAQPKKEGVHKIYINGKT